MEQTDLCPMVNRQLPQSLWWAWQPMLRRLLPQQCLPLPGPRPRGLIPASTLHVKWGQPVFPHPGPCSSLSPLPGACPSPPPPAHQLSGFVLGRKGHGALSKGNVLCPERVSTAHLGLGHGLTCAQVQPPEPMTMAFVGNRVITDGHGKAGRGHAGGEQVAPQDDWCLCKRKLETERQTKGECHVVTMTEKVMVWQPPPDAREVGQMSPCRLCGRGTAGLLPPTAVQSLSLAVDAARESASWGSSGIPTWPAVQTQPLPLWWPLLFSEGSRKQVLYVE